MLALFALVMPVAYAGDQGEAPIAAIGGALSLPFVLRAKAPAFGVAVLALLAVWCAVTFAWSPLEPDLFSVHRYAQLEALTAPKLLLQALLYPAFVYGALRLGPDQRHRALTVLAALTAATVVVLLIEGMEGGRIYGWLNLMVGRRMRADLVKRDAARGCYAVALLIWPMALATWGRVPAAIPIASGLATAVAALMLGVDAPAATLAVSSLVFLAMRVNARLGAWVCLVGVAIYFLAAPLVFLPHGGAPPMALPDDVGKMSWHIRIDIWRFASGLIAHRPLLGYGLDSSRTWPDQIPMHPHDAAIQLWLETGVVGALLGALFWGWLFFRIQKAAAGDPVWAAMAAATAAAYLLIGAISFGVWQEWWLALGAVALAACAMVLNARREAEIEPVARRRGLQAL